MEHRVYRFVLPFTDVCVYEQEDGSHRATLNGVLLPEIFDKDIPVEEVKACCMNILFAKYVLVINMIEKSVKGNTNEGCKNDLCHGHKQSDIDVPVQSEKGHQLKINK